MLDIARGRPGGGSVSWVVADGRSVRPGRRLTDAGHSRNPTREEWREWAPELTLRHFEQPEIGRVTAWNDVSMDESTQIVSYETCYRNASGSIQKATSRIRFATRNDIAQRIAEAGLRVERWMGDWSSGPWTETSPEIIPLGGLA